MSWNYRVMVRTWPGGEKTYGIYEVYYDKRSKAEASTVEGMSPYGDTLAELKADFALMKKAFSAPVLDYKTRQAVTPSKEKA
jgi:hypothetical protein